MFSIWVSVYFLSCLLTLAKKWVYYDYALKGGREDEESDWLYSRKHK